MDKKTVGIILIILGIILTPALLGIPLLIIGIINIVQGEVELEREKDNSSKKELKENKQQIKNDKKIYYELNKIKKVCKFCNKEILETDKVVNYKKNKWDNTYINKAHSSCYKSYRGINSHINDICFSNSSNNYNIISLCSNIFIRKEYNSENYN